VKTTILTLPGLELRPPPGADGRDGKEGGKKREIRT
jgi:hypothetical protein